MKQRYLYHAYGLIILSEILLTELKEIGEGEPDVVIRMDIVPESIEDAVVKMVRFEASPGAFLLKVDGIAKYYVREGKEIIVEPYNVAREEDIRLFLLGSAFAALLHQRQTLVLHGSAIGVNGKGVIFTGVSGAGKSTLAAALFQKGYPILTDDVCAVKISAQEAPQIIPGFPRLKLWADAAEKLGTDVSNLPRIREKLDKYGLKVENAFQQQPLPVKSIYILSNQDQEGVSITPLAKLDKLEALIKNTYRFRFLEGQGGKPRHFQQCVEVAKAAEIYQVVRPRGGFCLDELVSALEKELREL